VWIIIETIIRRFWMLISWIALTTRREIKDVEIVRF
jgi:hypothetical protein